MAKKIKQNPYRAGRRARPFFKEVVLGKILPALCVCTVLVGGVWFYTSGEYENIKQRSTDFLIKKSAEMGFVVQNLSVKGRKNLSPESVTAVLNIKSGDPLFIFDPDVMHEQLEGLSWVKKARIERHLPNTVYIEITEREPFALWQNEGAMAVIDDEGVVLTREHLGKYGPLLQVIGKNANIRVAELAQYLSLVPEIQSRVENATWVGDRRWNLLLKSDITVRLPEKDVPQALQVLAKMHNEDKLLDRAIVLVDLRLADKVIVRPELGANTQIERPNFDEEKSRKDKAI